MSVENVMPVSPRCPTCGTIMSLTGYSPTCESAIYDYLCRSDGDRLSWRPRLAAPNGLLQADA
jgi:hypothetical protein